MTYRNKLVDITVAVVNAWPIGESSRTSFTAVKRLAGGLYSVNSVTTVLLCLSNQPPLCNSYSCDSDSDLENSEVFFKIQTTSTDSVMYLETEY